MTYYIAENSHVPHYYICMSEDLHYRWFKHISDIDVTRLTEKSRIYKVEDWLNLITPNGMRFICKFDESNNPEMFI